MTRHIPITDDRAAVILALAHRPERQLRPWRDAVLAVALAVVFGLSLSLPVLVLGAAR